MWKLLLYSLLERSIIAVLRWNSQFSDILSLFKSNRPKDSNSSKIHLIGVDIILQKSPYSINWGMFVTNLSKSCLELVPSLSKYTRKFAKLYLISAWELQHYIIFWTTTLQLTEHCRNTELQLSWNLWWLYFFFMPDYYIIKSGFYSFKYG